MPSIDPSCAQKVDCRLRSDARHAGHVVARVARQNEVVADEAWRDCALAFGFTPKSDRTSGWLGKAAFANVTSAPIKARSTGFVV